MIIVKEGGLGRKSRRDFLGGRPGQVRK